MEISICLCYNKDKQFKKSEYLKKWWDNMKSELKRALLKKSNFVLIIVVVGLMIINAYYGGWKTALRADSAQDLLNIEDVIFFKNIEKVLPFPSDDTFIYPFCLLIISRVRYKPIPTPSVPTDCFPL